MKTYASKFSSLTVLEKGQGQPKDIICIILVVFKYQMLHTKF